MARTAKLVCGSDEIDLIDAVAPGVDGILASAGGFGTNSIDADTIFSSSQLADSASLRLKTYKPVVERWRLNMTAASHDSAATQMQALLRMLRKGDLKSLTQWQNEFVYIQEQATNETNARYSKVIGWRTDSWSDFFNQPFENNYEFDHFEIVLIREPFWRSTAPGVMPSAEAIKTPGFLFFDTIGGTAANASVEDGDAALSGNFGWEIAVSGAGSEVYGTLDDLINNMTSFAVEIQFKLSSDFAMGTGESFELINAVGSGTGGIALGAYIIESSGTLYCTLYCCDDAGVKNGLRTDPITLGVTHTVKVVFTASTGPGNDDGTASGTYDGTEFVYPVGIDNDTHDVDSLNVGSVSGLDAGTSGTLYVDRIRWADADDDTWHETVDFELTEAFVSNHRQSTGVLSHIYSFDASATGYSANLINDANFPLFEVSGSTPTTGDMMYFGSDEPFFMLVFHLGTAGVVDEDTPILEYSTTTGWEDTYISPEEIIEGFTGFYRIGFEGADDWAAQSVNSVSKYWLRIRLDTVNTWTTSPENSLYRIQSINNPYLEISDQAVHGDVPALSLHRLIPYSGGNSTVTGFLIGGKSKGFDNFISHFNAGGDNPVGWTESYGTDTSGAVADPTSPGGTRATCTFATNQTNLVRFTIYSTAAIATDFFGTYRMYARVEQTGGGDGNVVIQGQIIYGTTYTGKQIKMQDTGYPELIDLGVFSILPDGLLGDEVSTALLPLYIKLFAQSNNGATPNLYIYDIILLPMDEIVFSSSWGYLTEQDTGFVAQSEYRALQIDSGILREKSHLISRALYSDANFMPVVDWLTKSRPVTIEPRKNMRLYFIFFEDNFPPDGVFRGDQGQGMVVRQYLHERWYHLRGSD